MKEREIIAQLKQMKAVRPSQQWLQEQAVVLRAQVYSGVEEREELGFWSKFEIMTARLSQPYAMVALIALFFLGSGTAGWVAGQNAKPGEPLYIAKQLSEKAQFALAFNDKSKAKLNLAFARERASEILAMIASNQNGDKVAGLSNDFHKELSAAMARLERIMPQSKATVRPVEVAATKPKATAKAAPAKAAAKPAVAKNQKATTSQPTDPEYFTAGANKDGLRVDISAVDPTVPKVDNAQEAVKKAEDLFNNQDYQGAQDVLNQANQLLDQAK